MARATDDLRSRQTTLFEEPTEIGTCASSQANYLCTPAGVRAPITAHVVISSCVYDIRLPQADGLCLARKTGSDNVIPQDLESQSCWQEEIQDLRNLQHYADLAMTKTIDGLIEITVSEHQHYERGRI